MEKVRNIEALSLLFTAGIAAGTALEGWFQPMWGGLLLCLVIVLALLRKEALVPPLFILLGCFCAINSSIVAAGWSLDLGRDSSFIDRIPWTSATTAPLLKTLLTGDRSALDPGTVEMFRSSGASHLLALSGLHMGILYLIVDRLLWPFGKSVPMRYIRFSLIVSLSAVFTLYTGASPSLTRAFLFILINECLQLTGRERRPSRVLCLALFIQLVIDPQAIRSTGFQLSYLAMAGIFLLYPFLEKWYPGGLKYDPMRRLWQVFAMSISCQLFTAPLVWVRFHTFPRYFLLTNLFAIPATTALMSLAVGCLALGAAGICPLFLVKATDAVCNALLWILGIIASM